MARRVHRLSRSLHGPLDSGGADSRRERVGDFAYQVFRAAGRVRKQRLPIVQYQQASDVDGQTLQEFLQRLQSDIGAGRRSGFRAGVPSW
jgi:hypothetical protein